MFSKFLTLICGFCFLTSLPNDVSAFDGQRKGFIIGFGLGPGLISFTETGSQLFRLPIRDRVTKFALVTDFRLGYAPDNLVQIYYVNKVAVSQPIPGDDVVIANGIAGIGLSYYFQKETPSAFLSGGLGLSTRGVFTSGKIDEKGFGIFVGAGYEFLKHSFIEFNLSWERPESRFVQVNAFTLKAAISVLGY